jgi:hypothetical protein
MTPEQEAHLRAIQGAFCKGVDDKYRRGQAEHGGDLWTKPGMLGRLTDEVRDFVVYAHTLDQQLREVQRLLEAGELELGCRMLATLLDGPVDS